MIKVGRMLAVNSINNASSQTLKLETWYAFLAVADPGTAATTALTNCLWSGPHRDESR